MEDHAYFFTGNCQTQYLASMIGAVSGAERYFVGHRYGVNVALDGPLVDCVDKRGFYDNVRRVNREGRRSILFVLETSRSRFINRVGTKRSRFSDVVLVPHVHFKTEWPPAGPDGAPLSDSRVRRTFDWERHDFLSKVRRSGIAQPEAFADAYWEKCRTDIHFYHPGHPTGEIMADVFEAYDPEIKARIPCLQDLVGALRRSAGIYQNSNHPITARAGELLNLSWAQTPIYRTWIALNAAGAAGGPQLSEAVGGGRDIIKDPQALSALSWPYQAHFRASFGAACLQLGLVDEGLPALQQATIELKGHGPLVRRTLTQAVRARRLDAVENVLIGVAPHLQVNGDVHAGYEACFQSVLALKDGRQALGHVQDQTDPGSWVHRYIDRMVAAA